MRKLIEDTKQAITELIDQLYLESEAQYLLCYGG